ncbi:MAG: hypothetical protein ACI4MY_05625, partial [Christensenellales bacterium]
YNVKFTPSQQRLLATLIKIFGSVLFTSDDTGRYNDSQKKLFAEVMQEGETWVEDVTQNGTQVTVKYSVDGNDKVLRFDMKNCATLS